MNSRQEKRRKQVHAMRASFALEGMYPDALDLTLQEAYIMGNVSISDMLEHARAFAACHSQGAASSREPYQAISQEFLVLPRTVETSAG